MTTTSRSSNSNLTQLIQSALGAQKPLLSFAFALITLSGCFENVKGINLTPKLTTTSVATYTTSSAFTLSKVVLNQNDPAGTFDVWDNGSTSIAKYCPSTTSGATTTINCSCVFDFQYTDQSTSVTTSQEILVDPTYAEGDLVRCPYSQVPASVTSVGVSIQTKDGVSKSSQVTYTFGTGTGVLDTSKIFNFNRVYRYTCRLKAYVPNAMDLTSGIYDPDQSEKDPSNTYAMSFYTSNLGASIDAFAGNNSSSTPISDYECPANPLHPDPAFAETIYSSSPLSGDWVISGNPERAAGTAVDMNADNARSTFYLSRVKTGVFTVNVNAYIAPSIISQAVTTPNPQGGGIPSLGWGAQPRTTGAGTEKCPDPTPGSVDYVTIPTGYQWVKVWLFRMPLPNRQFYYGANLQRLGMIGCNPGNWPTSSTVPEVTDCNATPGAPTNPAAPALGSGTAARFTNGTWMCFKPGTWTPYGVDTNYSCGKPNQAAWATSWSQNYTGGLGICTAAGAATNATPFDHSPTAQYIDNQQSSRYEFFFVVTPPTVNTGDMSNSASPVYAQYAPFRFRADSDCDKEDPSSCSTQHMWRNYGLKLHDVADAGDPPASDPSRAGVFPVCALQPIM